MSFSSFPDLAVQRSAHFPDVQALVFIHRNQPTEEWTFGDLHRAACGIARALQTSGDNFQKSVLLVMGHTPLFPAAMLGTLYSGAVAVPLPYITETRNVDAYLQSISAMAAYYEAGVIITLSAYQDRIQSLVNCPVLAADQIDRTSDTLPTLQSLQPEHAALILQSSGSTQQPKGAVFTHEALLKLVMAFGAVPTIRVDVTSITWLPAYHISGLLGAIVVPIAMGVRCVMISPSHWTRTPKVWFQAIHDYKANTASLPNSGFIHCLNLVSPEDIAGLDLSSLYMLNSTTEPIHAEILERFRERFGVAGFNPMIQGAYGMTENLGSITSTPAGERALVDWIDRDQFYNEQRAVLADQNSPHSMSVVSSGKSWWKTQIRIVSESGDDVPERQVGEIVCRSEYMFSEYYKAPELTAAALRDGWLYTGDLGYMANGHLFVTGRKKDLIIVGGKNVIPSDIEALAGQVDGIASGNVVAFGLPDASGMGTEQITIAAELDPTYTAAPIEVEQAIRRKVFEHTGIVPGIIKLYDSTWLVRTENGKLSRSACKEKFLQSQKLVN